LFEGWNKNELKDCTWLRPQQKTNFLQLNTTLLIPIEFPFNGDAALSELDPPHLPAGSCCGSETASRKVCGCSWRQIWCTTRQ